jgi:hypothetical protein
MNFENLKKKPWVQNILKIKEKNSKQNFFWTFNPVLNTLFWLHLVPGTTIEN